MVPHFISFCLSANVFMDFLPSNFYKLLEIFILSSAWVSGKHKKTKKYKNKLFFAVFCGFACLFKRLHSPCGKKINFFWCLFFLPSDKRSDNFSLWKSWSLHFHSFDNVWEFFTTSSKLDFSTTFLGFT